MDNPRVYSPPTAAQLLADLEWLLISAPLLSPLEGQARAQEFDTKVQGEIRQWLCSIEVQQVKLCAADFGLSSYQRLGRYAEKLLSYFLHEFRGSNGSRYEVIAQNLALRTDSPTHQTLGEIDYLLVNPAGQALHWELAVKFFLCEEQGQRCNPSTANLDEFLGPERQESLALKHKKLFSLQLNHPIPSRYSLHSWTPEAVTRGWMFYKLNEPLPIAQTREGQRFLHANHSQGFWLYADELEQLAAEFPDADFFILEKGEWLSPKNESTLCPERRLDVRSISLKLFHTPELLSVVKGHLEVARGFVRPSELRNIAP